MHSVANCSLCAQAPDFKGQAPTAELIEAIRWKARNNAAKAA
jgi:hypothetical protein